MRWRLTVEIQREKGGNRIIINTFNDKYERNEFFKRLNERFKRTKFTITITLCQNPSYRSKRKYITWSSTKLADEAKKGGYDINKAIKVLYPESHRRIRWKIKQKDKYGK